MPRGRIDLDPSVADDRHPVGRLDAPAPAAAAPPDHRPQQGRVVFEREVDMARGGPRRGCSSRRPPRRRRNRLSSASLTRAVTSDTLGGSSGGLLRSARPRSFMGRECSISRLAGGCRRPRSLLPHSHPSRPYDPPPIRFDAGQPRSRCWSSFSRSSSTCSASASCCRCCPGRPSPTSTPSACRRWREGRRGGDRRPVRRLLADAVYLQPDLGAALRPHRPPADPAD